MTGNSIKLMQARKKNTNNIIIESLNQERTLECSHNAPNKGWRGHIEAVQHFIIVFFNKRRFWFRSSKYDLAPFILFKNLEKYEDNRIPGDFVSWEVYIWVHLPHLDYTTFWKLRLFALAILITQCDIPANMKHTMTLANIHDDLPNYNGGRF